MSQFETATAVSANIRAVEHQECPECFDPLYVKPVAVLCSAGSQARICSHYFHLDCVSINKRSSCTVCSKHFEEVRPMPNPVEKPEDWFAVVDTDSDGQLGFEELLDGLKAQLALDWRKIDIDADNLWSKWDPDGSGTISKNEFLDPTRGVLAYLQQNYPLNVTFSPPPSIKQDKGAWFDFWDEDKSGSLDKGEVARALIKTFKVMKIDRYCHNYDSNSRVANKSPLFRLLPLFRLSNYTCFCHIRRMLEAPFMLYSKHVSILLTLYYCRVVGLRLWECWK